MSRGPVCCRYLSPPAVRRLVGRLRWAAQLRCQKRLRELFKNVAARSAPILKSSEFLSRVAARWELSQRMAPNIALRVRSYRRSTSNIFLGLSEPKRLEKNSCATLSIGGPVSRCLSATTLSMLLHSIGWSKAPPPQLPRVLWSLLKSYLLPSLRFAGVTPDWNVRHCWSSLRQWWIQAALRPGTTRLRLWVFSPII